eukprot:4503593-Amphidinium_carterae.1
MVSGPDPERMERNLATGECECLQSGTQDAAVSTGGICIDMADFNEVLAEASPVRTPFPLQSLQSFFTVVVQKSNQNRNRDN